jgi:hypothetical protein
MSLAVPITNSLTFIFSLLTGLLLGEKIGGKGTKQKKILYYMPLINFIDAWLGMGLVVVGVAICVGGK